MFDAPPEALVEDPSGSAVVAVALVTLAAAIGSQLARGDRPGGLFGEAVALAGLAYLPPIAFEGLPVVLAWSALAVVLAFVGSSGLADNAAQAAPAFLALAVLHVLGLEGTARHCATVSTTSASHARDRRRAGSLRRRAVGQVAPRGAGGLEILGAALVVYLPSVAIVDVTTTGELDPGQTPQVLLSAFWSVTGLAALVYGLLRDDREFRVGGLALLGIAIVKVFLCDLASLDEIYRVLSFIALGLLLLASAFRVPTRPTDVGAGLVRLLAVALASATPQAAPSRATSGVGHRRARRRPGASSHRARRRVVRARSPRFPGHEGSWTPAAIRSLEEAAADGRHTSTSFR